VKTPTGTIELQIRNFQLSISQIVSFDSNNFVSPILTTSNQFLKSVTFPDEEFFVHQQTRKA
jgi:hypothetical protein